MSSVRTLTGGTGDVNPQRIGATFSQPTANTFAQFQIPIPVLRVAMRNNTSQVVELLRVRFEVGNAQYTGGDTELVSLTLQSKDSVANIASPDTIAHLHRVVVSVGGTGTMQINKIETFDLTDQAGHGMIVAVPNLFLGINGIAQSFGLIVAVQITYRFKNVGLQEFLGLAIQQSSGGTG